MQNFMPFRLFSQSSALQLLLIASGQNTLTEQCHLIVQVGGYVAMNLVMPTMLSWVLGGNLSVFNASDRRPLCHLCDKPKHFEEQVRFTNLLSLALELTDSAMLHCSGT